MWMMPEMLQLTVLPQLELLLQDGPAALQEERSGPSSLTAGG
jgi:hypothetical protein